MCSLGDAETTSSSSTAHYASTLNANMDVDDRITDLLDSLRFIIMFCAKENEFERLSAVESKMDVGMGELNDQPEMSF